ncbi:DUF222 domain-containing protein [Kribbella sp. NPDC005582]|uniref:HNH endonuclease signature motif containing protein n=1 Tax=Kribbella sp. NPDC005582 TaxID=3156893 RepID=UPI0033A8D296
MELLGERPAWSMNGSEALSAIDSIDAEIARLETSRLPYVARVDETGHAEDLGARNTAELLTFRYRMDPRRAHGMVRLARALPKYSAVTDALPDPTVAVPVPDGTDETLPPEVPLRPDQAAVIVSMLEKVPPTVPVETLRVAEKELVKLGRDLSPADLRKAAQRARDILDQDGPEPDEQKAYARERLTLIPDEHGVRFSGYLANDNAELMCSTIHTGARPHRTIAGELDPRPAEKRRADALSGTLRIAAAVTDAGDIRTTTPTTPTTPDTTASPTDAPATASSAASRSVPAPAGAPAPVATSAPAHEPAAAPAPVPAPASAPAPAAAPGPASATVADPATPQPDSAVPNAATAADPAAHIPPTWPPSANSPAQPDAAVPNAATAPSQPGSPAEVYAHANPAAGTLLDTEATGGAATQAERCATDAASATLGPVVADNWVPGFGAKATLVVTIDWQDLKSATADCIGDTVYGAGLSASTARLLACDAKIIPVVLGSNSEPLDVGRCERLVTKGMRRALNTRDRGCVVCNAPPVQCDAHHLISWIDGGITAVSNLVLLCRIHHVDLHAGKWIITITDGKVHVDRPSWANPPSLGRRTPPPDPPLAIARADAGRTSSTTNLSTMIKLGVTEPDATGLGASGATEPGVTERGATNPSTTKSSASMPDTIDAGTFQPGTSKPGATVTSTDELGTDGVGTCGPGAGGARADESFVDGLVRRGSDEGGRGGSVLTATDVRAATMRAVWGEDLPSEPPRHRARLSASPDFDPWGEAGAGATASPPCAPQ